MPALLANVTPRGRIVLGLSALARRRDPLLRHADRRPPELLARLDRHGSGRHRQGRRGARRGGHQVRAAQQRHRARRREVADRAGADRARRQGPRRRVGHAARLRALRQAEDRDERLPAAGHLPARAGGPDLQDDRPGPGRQRLAGAPRPRRGPALLRVRDPRDRGRPADRLVERAGAQRGARHRAARLLQRQGPEARATSRSPTAAASCCGRAARAAPAAAASPSRPCRRATSRRSRPASPRCSRAPSGPARPRSRSAPTSTPTRRRRTS